MKATVMYKSGDVRVEEVPDPVIKEPTDAVIRVTYACVRVGPAPLPRPRGHPGGTTDGP
jgi:hypothetical protein